MKYFNKIISVSNCFLAGSVLMTFMSCEKDLDYTVPPPPEGNTFSRDVDSVFRTLSSNPDLTWVWTPKPYLLNTDTLPQFTKELLGMGLKFSLDSTATAYTVGKTSLVIQLINLINSGKLSSADRSFAIQLANIFFDFIDLDATLRYLLIENPANADLLEATQYFLPNLINFNPIEVGIAEAGFDYNINGPVQLSMTFTNTKVFPLLKQGQVLDYDFRIFSYAKDSVELNGYYGFNTYKKSMLYASKLTDIDKFARASQIICSPTLINVNVALRINGTVVPTPAGHTSGLDFFYKKYKQDIYPSVRNYGFSLLAATAEVPAALRNIKVLTVSDFYNGTLSTAPAGTVLVTMIGDGNATQKVELVKQ